MTAADEPFGALLAPITLRTAGERIAERLVTAIALGEFIPGQRLPAERDLAAMLEVSRTTVREALQRLQAAGYVTARRGRLIPVHGKELSQRPCRRGRRACGGATIYWHFRPVKLGHSRARFEELRRDDKEAWKHVVGLLLAIVSVGLVLALLTVWLSS